MTLEFVKNKNQLIDNSKRFESYSRSTNNQEQEFYKERVKLGKMFLHIRTSSRNVFCPSRFVGYENNSMQKHEAFDEKTGTRTNQKIQKNGVRSFNITRPPVLK